MEALRLMHVFFMSKQGAQDLPGWFSCVVRHGWRLKMLRHMHQRTTPGNSCLSKLAHM